MTRLELTALMAAVIAAGYRANSGDAATETINGIDLGRSDVAKWAARDAAVVLDAVEERATADDNQPLVYVEPEDLS